MVFNFIEKYKFAILGTALFHLCFFIYSNFVTIERPHQYTLVPPPEDLSMEIPLDDIPLDPEMMELLKVTPPGQDANQPVYNVTADANDTRDRSYEDFSTQEMDQQVAENAKALEEQYFNEWESTHAGTGGTNGSQSSSMDINDKKDQPQDKTQQNNVDKSVDTQGSNAFAGDVMASFNLKDRKVHALEKPGYTCNSAGTVTIEIKVDKNGDVQNVTYLPGSSSNATECMIQQSIKYAKRSRFNYSSTAPAVQTGTITYKFVSR